MRIIVGILLVLSLLGGGLARLVFAFQPKTNQPFLTESLSKTGLLIIALVNIVFSIVGIVCLIMGVFGPWQILFGVFVITSLVEIIIRTTSGKSPGSKPS